MSFGRREFWSDSPVNSNGQQRICGDVEWHGPQVVDRGAQQQSVAPGELFHHVVVHQERAAYHCHDEVRYGQVGNKQVGEVAELFVARQSGDEYEVSQTTDEHDANEHRADNNGGHVEGLTLCSVWDVISRDAVVHVVIHILIHRTRRMAVLHLCARCDRAADVGVRHVWHDVVVMIATASVEFN